MEPKVIRREKKLHLSYELPHRIHCSAIYPVTAPNGSTVILYGYDRGLRVLWRGGRRVKEQSTPSAPPQTNGVGKSQDVIVIDDDDDEPQTSHQSEDVDTYEAEEDDEDSDCPYAGIIQDVEIDLETEVLRLATPSLSTSVASQHPSLVRTHMIVAVACSNAKVMLLTIPLAPPKTTTSDDFIEGVISEAIDLEGGPGIARDLAIKLVARSNEQPTQDRSRSKSDTESGGRLLVATVSNALNIWNLMMETDSTISSQKSQLPIMHSPIHGSSVAFHPSSRSNQLLIADKSGAVRIYDAFASRNLEQRPSSRESASSIPANSEEVGRWMMTYHSPFQTSQSDNPALVRRKKILDASWVLGARGILVLLEDGEWGIWDLSGSSQTGKNIEEFALRGFLGSSSTTEVAESGKQRKGGPKLAPMTPNTRKAKAETLFSGTPRAPGVAATGGISVATTSPRSGQVDESVVIWYNSDIYSITSMQSFWQRSTSGASGGSGSLYAPGLNHISDVDLMNENITSISQFASKSTATGLGQMNTQRDVLVSAEHRFVILQNLRPTISNKGLFQQAAERPTFRDQRMLDAHDLDLGGMDRMLDSMAGDARARKVGFAH